VPAGKFFSLFHFTQFRQHIQGDGMQCLGLKPIAGVWPLHKTLDANAGFLFRLASGTVEYGFIGIQKTTRTLPAIGLGWIGALAQQQFAGMGYQHCNTDPGCFN